jgi:polyhydroxybutyrate depolymerase
LKHLARGATTTGTSEQTLTVDDRERSYVLHVGKRVGRSWRGVPLVIAFHGRWGTGRGQQWMSGFDAVADRESFVVAYPNGIGRSWNAGTGAGDAERLGIDDVHFVRTLIDDVAELVHIDRHRVFATGMSNGGNFVHRLGCELSMSLAAIAPVAGTIASGIAKQCEPERPIPVIMIHGREDAFSPFDGGETAGGGRVESVAATARLWAEHNRCEPEPATSHPADGVTRLCYAPRRHGATVELYEIDGAGHTWPGAAPFAPDLLGVTPEFPIASETIWTFFTAQRR